MASVFSQDTPSDTLDVSEAKKLREHSGSTRWGLRKLAGKLFKYQFLLRLITVEPVLFLMAAGTDMAHAAQSPGLYWKICKIHTQNYPDIDCLHLKTFAKHQKSSTSHNRYDHFQNFTVPNLSFLNKTENHVLRNHSGNKTQSHHNNVSMHMESPNIENDVQKSAADWNMYIHLASVIPLIIVAPLYGAFSDRNGRKINILLGLTGLMMSSFMYVIQLTFVDMSLVMLPATQAFIALTGIQGNIYASCYSYISDRTPDKSLLTRKFMILHVVTDIARIITSYGTGGILEIVFFTKPLVAGMAIITLAFLYTLFFTVQKPPKETQESRKRQASGLIPLNTEPIHARIRNPFAQHRKMENGDTAFKNDKHNGVSQNGSSPQNNDALAKFNIAALPSKLLSLLENCFSCFIKVRQGHYRSYLFATVVAFFLLYIASMGMHTILHLFEQRTPLAWNGPELAYYKGFTEVVNLVGTVFTVLILKRLHFHETTILLISVTSSIIRFILIGFSRNTAMMYVAGIFGAAGSLTQPVSKSLVCQFVDPDEVGKIYVLFALAMDGALIISQTLVTQLYKATLEIHPGFIFFIVAGVLCITFAILLWIHIDYRRYRQHEGLDENGQVQTKEIGISTVA